MSKINLLLIDPQWDFCHAGDPDYDPTNPDPNPFIDFAKRPGTLYVPGADKDSDRVAKMINDGGKKIDEITTTMDSHRSLHIAHADFFRDDQGNMPTPLVDTITLPDMVGKNPKWHTYNPSDQDWVVNTYLPGLEAGGRNPHTIWPKHCIWGSGGWQLYPSIQGAIQRYCEKFQAQTGVKFKGQNYRTEWFSAVQADVEDPTDHQTSLDTDFMDQFKAADLFVFAGQALSHCILWTFTDIVNYLGDKFVKKCLLIIDGTSPVPIPPCIQAAEEFVAKYKSMGMQTCKAEEFASGA